METEAITEVLGGRKVLGKSITTPNDLARLVRAGLPAGSFRFGAGRPAASGGRRSLAETGHSAADADSAIEPRISVDGSRIGRTVRMARVYACG